MQDIYGKLAKMRIALEEKLTHPFLEEYLPSPKIDEDKLFLLYSIFDEIDLSDDLKNTYIMTAMLVQIALDTHDNVTTKDHVDTTEFVERQLTVLAGDYFSGLYYYMLSEVQDIKMVRTLAEAIREINEHKIRLYHDDSSVSETINNIIHIETALFQKIIEHFCLDPWNEFSTTFLTYKRFAKEKIFYENEQNFEQRRLLTLNDITKVCSMYFEKANSLLDTKKLEPNLNKDMLLKRLHSIRFHETIHDKKTVEEGL